MGDTQKNVQLFNMSLTIILFLTTIIQTYYIKKCTTTSTHFQTCFILIRNYKETEVHNRKEVLINLVVNIFSNSSPNKNKIVCKIVRINNNIHASIINI